MLRFAGAMTTPPERAIASVSTGGVKRISCSFIAS
jgi:hypothetical protein